MKSNLEYLVVWAEKIIVMKLGMIEVNIGNDKGARNNGEDTRETRKLETDWCVYMRRDFSSVAQSCPTLCNPMNRSTPGFPVHHKLPEFTQTHVHRVSDAIQPSYPLSSLSPPAPNPYVGRVIIHTLALLEGRWWYGRLQEIELEKKGKQAHRDPSESGKGLIPYLRGSGWTKKF